MPVPARFDRCRRGGVRHGRTRCHRLVIRFRPVCTLDLTDHLELQRVLDVQALEVDHFIRLVRCVGPIPRKHVLRRILPPEDLPIGRFQHRSQTGSVPARLEDEHDPLNRLIEGQRKRQRCISGDLRGLLHRHAQCIIRTYIGGGKSGPVDRPGVVGRERRQDGSCLELSDAGLRLFNQQPVCTAVHVLHCEFPARFRMHVDQVLVGNLRWAVFVHGHSRELSRAHCCGVFIVAGDLCRFRAGVQRQAVHGSVGRPLGNGPGPVFGSCRLIHLRRGELRHRA